MRIKYVDIHVCSNEVYGFVFYDNQNATICKAGFVEGRGLFEDHYAGRVLLEDNEVIIGFIANKISYLDGYEDEMNPVEVTFLADFQF